jgi:hypothetical protein
MGTSPEALSSPQPSVGGVSKVSSIALSIGEKIIPNVVETDSPAIRCSRRRWTALFLLDENQA